MRLEFTLPEVAITDTGDGLALACGVICQRTSAGTLVTNVPEYTFSYWSFLFVLAKNGGALCRSLF